MKQVFCALALGCIVWATSSFADPVRVATALCYLWPHQASPALNTPYSVNAQNTAVAISVTRTATGTYMISGGPWGSGGQAQVSAYGNGLTTLCHVGSWSIELATLFPICQRTCP
jgi:hypothetical protein